MKLVITNANAILSFRFRGFNNLNSIIILEHTESKKENIDVKNDHLQEP